MFELHTKRMTTVNSFPPIAHPSAHTLILGSMPGVLSLRASQYYAHPRNAFWPIMASLYGFNAALPYTQRVGLLQAAGVAVWDVLHSCVRPGSLDSAIAQGTRVPNDIETFLRQHPHIKLVGFNGAEAEKSFRAYAGLSMGVDSNPNPGFNTATALNAGLTSPQGNAPVQAGHHPIRFVRLPSSSPAHATLSLAQKTAIRRELLVVGY